MINNREALHQLSSQILDYCGRLLLVEAIASACGDKLMLVMGSRSSQIKPLHPSAIPAYPGQSASATLIRSLQSQSAFQLVEDWAGLDNARKTGKYDVV